MIKWLLAGVGLYIQGGRGLFIGYFLGYFLGYFFEYFNILNISGIFNVKKNAKGMSAEEFNNHTLILSSFVIKADGIKQVELDFVRDFFVKNYGKKQANASFRFFNDIVKSQNISLEHTAQKVRDNTRYASRLQIIHFLFGIANSDGFSSDNEVQVIFKIAQNLGVADKDFRSIRSMFLTKEMTYDPYTILEIKPSATQEELKQAYRKMAKLYHPDKVQHLGEVHQKGAREKFQEIQKAYDYIQKERKSTKVN